MATSSIGANSAATSSTVSTDVYNRVQQTLASQNAGVLKLNTALTKDQTKLSALGQLQSALAGFQSLAAGLAGGGLSSTTTASSPTVLTPAATGATTPGTYAVEVKQLAQGQFLTSGDFASSSAKIGTGATTTVKIDFGTAGTAGFVAGGAGKSISIDSSNNTLDGIAAALKAAGVNATVTKDDKGYALTIAGQTGAANSMRISVSGDAALKDLLAYNPDGTQKLTQTTSAQDAKLTVSGVDVTSASNTVTSAIAGTSLTLTATGKTNVSIAQSPTQISSNVKAFAAAYNALNQKLQALQKGDLKSDVAVGQVTSQLSLLLKTGGGSVSPSALGNAGVSLDSSGNMLIDDKKLQAALASDPAAVSKLFTNNGKGIADQLGAKASAFTSATGIINKEVTSTNKDLASVNTKRTALSTALTAQANALVALYTQQAQDGSGSALGGVGGSGTLFDMLG